MSGPTQPQPPQVQPAAAPQPALLPMPAAHKFLLGGLGAVVPTVASLAVVDLEPVLAHMTLLAGLGLAVKVVLLFLIGGVWAWLHRQENQRARVFELGIVAPATILTLSNGIKAAGPAGIQNTMLPAVVEFFSSEAYAQTPPVAIQQQRSVGTIRGRVVQAETEEPLPGVHVHVRGTDVGTLTAETGAFELNIPPGSHTLLIALIGFSSVAQLVEVEASRTTEVEVALEPAMIALDEIVISRSVKSVQPPRESGVQQFLRGLLGRSDPRVWYVAGESYDTREAAARKAHEYIVALDDPDAARVYEEPDPDRPGATRFLVVFGTNLRYEEASALRQKIEALGLSAQGTKIVRR